MKPHQSETPFQLPSWLLLLPLPPSRNAFCLDAAEKGVGRSPSFSSSWVGRPNRVTASDRQSREAFHDRHLKLTAKITKKIYLVLTKHWLTNIFQKYNKERVFSHHVQASRVHVVKNSQASKPLLRFFLLPVAASSAVVSYRLPAIKWRDFIWERGGGGGREEGWSGFNRERGWRFKIGDKRLRCFLYYTTVQDLGLKKKVLKVVHFES